MICEGRSRISIKRSPTITFSRVTNQLNRQSRDRCHTKHTFSKTTSSSFSAMEASSSSSTMKQKPVAIITIGMAGAGKSTFVQRINSYLHSQDPPTPPYILNLDPAVTHLPFEANIDIRDTVNYQEVMKQCVPDVPVPLQMTNYICSYKI